MSIIGVTGSFGSGKSLVAHFFKQKGATVIDADQIAHDLMEPQAACFLPVVRIFGQGILHQGQIDRKKIADIVFHEPMMLKKLCDVIHPNVAQMIKKEIRAHDKRKKSSVLVLDVPLLIEAGMQNLCDIVIVVTCDIQKQIIRLKQRSGLTQDEITRRIKAQMPIEQKTAFAHFVIDNNGTINQTQKQVEEAWIKIQKKK